MRENTVMNAAPSLRPGTPGLSAGILAGGAGRRFGGQDKGWIEYRGKPLICWTLDGLRNQADELLISANRNLERYAGLGVPVVRDDADGFEGPFAGIVALLGAARELWLLCLPCDALHIRSDLAQSMLDRAVTDQADIVVLADAQGIHPTFSLIRTALAADARQCFEAGERAPRRWFARHALSRLQAPPPLNLNTPESLAALKSGL